MENKYFTTPIYYVNDKPHIGHAYTSISVDVLKRFYKLNNRNQIEIIDLDNIITKLFRRFEFLMDTYFFNDFY